MGNADLDENTVDNFHYEYPLSLDPHSTFCRLPQPGLLCDPGLKIGKIRVESLEAPWKVAAAAAGFERW
jgi:hypothetical protein